MSEIINAKPRFGLEGDTLFDYASSANIPIVEGATVETPEGVWDVAKVAELIRAGKSIEAAYAPLSDALGANLQLAQENEALRKANDDYRAQIDSMQLNTFPRVPSEAELANQGFGNKVTQENPAPTPTAVEQANADFAKAGDVPAEQPTQETPAPSDSPPAQ